MEKINFTIPQEEVQAYLNIPSIELGMAYENTEGSFYTATIDSNNIIACTQLLNALEESMTAIDSYAYTQSEWNDPVLVELREITNASDKQPNN